MNCMNLKNARKKAGYTQEAVAEIFGYAGPATISAWECGDNLPDIDKVTKLAKLYKCDIAYLAGEQDCPVKEYSEYGKYTGLSENAIEILNDSKVLNPAFNKIISDLIENTEIINLLKEARQADIISKRGFAAEDMEKEKQLRQLSAWEAIRRFMGDI